MYPNLMELVYHLIVVQTMEFYEGTGWVKAYEIGLYGEYCEGSDHFVSGKWNEYPKDIQFLTLSWFLF